MNERAGLRDVTAHGYYTLRMEDIWETVTKDVPLFLTQIDEIFNTEQEMDQSHSSCGRGACSEQSESETAYSFGMTHPTTIKTKPNKSKKPPDPNNR